MSNQRAHYRRAERRRARAARAVADGLIPAVPGVVPNASQAMMDLAMEEAHVLFDGIPGQVRVAFYPLAEGLKIVADGWGPDAVETIRKHAERMGGDDPHVTIASRGFWSEGGENGGW